MVLFEADFCQPDEARHDGADGARQEVEAAEGALGAAADPALGVCEADDLGDVDGDCQ